MPDPAITAGSIAAAVSTVTLAVLGVDYYSLLYGLVGALLALSQAGAMGRGRAIVYVSLSTLVGAVIGNFVVAYLDSKSRHILIFGCLIGGILAQVIVAAVLKAGPVLADAVAARLKAFIEKFGGPST